MKRWLPLLLIFALGCYEGFGDVGVDDDDTFVPGDDDTASDDDDGASDDDDTVAELPLCEELPADVLAAVDDCHAVEPFATFEPNEEVEWQWTGSSTNPNYDQVIVAPVVIGLTDDNGDGQIDRDDVPDVVFYSMNDGAYTGGVTRAVSGVDGSELWNVNASTLRVFPNAHLAAGDLLPEHPGPEIVIITDASHVACLSAAGEELWRTDPGENLQRGAPALHDMNGDGSPEVIVGRVILSASGELLGKGEHGRGDNEGRGRMTFAVDVDADGALEVIAGNAVYDMAGVAEWSNGLSDGYPGVADFDLDGDPEIIVVSEGAVRLQDHAGAVLWGPVEIAGTGRGGPPTIADYDGDGLPEVGVANKGFYTVLDTDGGLLWSRETQDVSSGMTGSSVFDFNGDGQAEVVYADEVTLWVYQGSDGQVLLQEENHTSRTQLEYPVITDIDGDDHAEIVLGSNDYFTAGWSGITVLGTTVDRGGWWKARRVWNQHAFFFTHIDEDGVIPAVQGKPWLVHNSFRQNFPPDTWEGYPAADLVAVADGPCVGADDALLFAARVGNEGAWETSVAPQVAVFATTTSEELLLGTGSSSGTLGVGILSSTILVPWDEALGTGEFRVRADDNGYGVGYVTECQEEDNDADWP